MEMKEMLESSSREPWLSLPALSIKQTPTVGEIDFPQSRRIGPAGRASRETMDIVLFLLRILIVVALYAFLGVILWALLREQSPATQVVTPTAQLTPLTNDDNNSSDRDEPGRHYSIQSAAWIGRDPNCLVRADNEFASARHAQVLWRAEDRAWWIEDNLSRNGTFVNDHRVTHAVLKDGDVIQVGRARFRFTISDWRFDESSV